MRHLLLCACVAVFASALSAHPGVFEPFLDFEIRDTTAPPGGTAQIVVWLTEPKPITTGRVSFSLSTSLTTVGIYLFSPNGDVSGAATQTGGTLQLQFVSPSGTYGLGLAYGPIMVITVKVDPNAKPGDQIPVVLDDLASVFTDPSGKRWAQAVRQGIITVGGTVSIDDVRPGGLVNTGGEVDVLGFGFQPGAAVIVPGAAIKQTETNSTDIDFAPLATTDLEGVVLSVVNPDLSSASYICYARPIYLRSNLPLLAATEPVFADVLTDTAVFGPLSTGILNGVKYMAAIAFENPIDNPVIGTAQVKIQAYSSSGQGIGETQLSLNLGQATLREISELLTQLGPQAGIYLRFTSTMPVKMLALQGEDSTGILLPVLPTQLPATTASNCIPQGNPTPDGLGECGY